MATVTIQITNAGNTVGRVKTISGGDLVRLVAAYKVNAPPMTDDQAVLAWADALLADTKQTVKQIERAVAVGGVSDIAIT